MLPSLFASRRSAPLSLTALMVLGLSCSSALAQDAPASGQPAAQPAAQLPAPSPLVVMSFEERIAGGELQRLEVVKSYPLRLDSPASSAEIAAEATRLRALIQARAAVPTRFELRAGHWAAQDVSGWKVDASVLEELITRQLSGEALVLEPERVAASRTARTLWNVGVRGHLASGVSSYAGSPGFRKTNVRVGAARFDGLKVPAGGTFDFNAVMGPTTRARGFVPGYVISGGTLKLEDGGGICQVSTTAFRALYQAGLPIVERHNHSHVVHYYDPVGFEATVYAPSKNLRMRNDTPGALWIQVTDSPGSSQLRFDVFGTDDGRRVTVGAPALSGWRAAPGARFQADSRVPLGRTWTLDTAQRGVTSVIERVIRRGDTVSRDTLRSVYRPWGALFGVHPSDRRAR